MATEDSQDSLKSSNSILVVNTEKLDEAVFSSHTSKREPVIFRSVDLGPCMQKWTPDYLISVLGDYEVKVHVCAVSQLDFVSKNFLYRSLKLSEYIRRTSRQENEPLEDYFIHPYEKYYLRSLGDDVRKDVANVSRQYPQICEDIKLPKVFPECKFFSSVFRIASPGCQLWTHYDVMDNILIQAVGHKQIVLFPPSDVPYLYLQGDKSTVLDPDNPDLEKYPLFCKAHPYRAVLQPGDVIFIPALWFHNVTAMEFSVAVNVFWKNLDESLYDPKDVYGNKDLLPASRAAQGVEKAIKALESLNPEYKLFYTLRIIDSLYKSLERSDPLVNNK